MSVMAAIDTAVRLQLLNDKPDHYDDYKRVMGADIPGPPVTRGYQFDAPSMEVFLQRVAGRLKFDTPSLNYDWTRTNSTKCLTANREVLIDLIARDTTQASGGA